MFHVLQGNIFSYGCYSHSNLIVLWIILCYDIIDIV
eukprot:UN02615